MRLLALDIGGANIKMAHSDGRAWSRRFALWARPNHLLEELKVAYMTVAAPADAVAVTMTGEMCDCFASRAEGVAFILDQVEAFADGLPVAVWTTHGRFAPPSDARRDPLRVAAANWHALATCVARKQTVDRALLVDVGSTTTDIIPLFAGACAARGLTDLERLGTGELLYTGVRRTPLIALGRTVYFGDRKVRVMAELFAQTADVYTLLNRLPEQPDCTATADGRPMTRQHAANRVLRMVGSDLGMHTMEDAVSLAKSFADGQRQHLVYSIRQRCRLLPPFRVVVCGTGEFLAADAAIVACSDTSVVRLSEMIGRDRSDAACAWALLQLWNGEDNEVGDRA